MKPIKKTVKERELFAELRYWQQQARMEARWLKQSRAKCKQIANQLRELKRSYANTD